MIEKQTVQEAVRLKLLYRRSLNSYSTHT